jgi:hypothetical protein
MTLQELINEIQHYINQGGLEPDDEVRFLTSAKNHKLSNVEISKNDNGEITFTFDLSKHY